MLIVYVLVYFMYVLMPFCTCLCFFCTCFFIYRYVLFSTFVRAIFDNVFEPVRLRPVSIIGIRSSLPDNANVLTARHTKRNVIEPVCLFSSFYTGGFETSAVRKKLDYELMRGFH